MLKSGDWDCAFAVLRSISTRGGGGGVGGGVGPPTHLVRLWVFRRLRTRGILLVAFEIRVEKRMLNADVRVNSHTIYLVRMCLSGVPGT